MRDDFDLKTKEILAKRVSMKCSNPNCRKPTGGPSTDKDKALNIGVAAHISAASSDGPRYDTSQTKDERKSIENAIWLCQNCAKLIDNDEKKYTKDILIEWKRLSEEAALYDIEYSVTKGNTSNDVELIKYYSQALDRPAFQDEFRMEGSMEAFDKAISDTIVAFNTGYLASRDNKVLVRSKGKSFVENTEWRKQLDSIVDILRAIRSRYEIAIKTGQLNIGSEHNGMHYYYTHNPELAEWMDKSRFEIIELFNTICKDAKIALLKFPRHVKSRW